MNIKLKPQYNLEFSKRSPMPYDSYRSFESSLILSNKKGGLSDTEHFEDDALKIQPITKTIYGDGL